MTKEKCERCPLWWNKQERYASCDYCEDRLCYLCRSLHKEFCPEKE